MSIPAYVYALKTFGKHTESAGTIIQENVQGHDGQTAVLTALNVTTGATAHTFSLMYAQGTGTRTTADGAAAAAQKDILCADDPKDPAGNAAASGDVIAYQVSDGSWEFNTVASLSSKTITLTNNIATALLDGAKVRIFGVVADGAVLQLPLGAGATNEWKNGELLLACPYVGDPCVLQIDNGTNASTLNNAIIAYINKDGGE